MRTQIVTHINGNTFCLQRKYNGNTAQKKIE